MLWKRWIGRRTLLGVLVLASLVAGLLYLEGRRVVSLALEEALRASAPGMLTVESVGGDLLSSITIHGLRLDTGGRDRTRVRLQLPLVRLSYGIFDILGPATSARPKAIHVERPLIRITRQGTAVDLERLSPLIHLLTKRLPGIPVRLAGGQVLLEGVFPEGPVALDLPRSEFMGSSRGLVYEIESALGGVAFSAAGAYATGIGTGQGVVNARGRLEKLPARCIPLSARLSGEIQAHGNVLFRTIPPTASDRRSRHWFPLQLRSGKTLYLSWRGRATLTSGEAVIPGWPDTIRQASLEADLGDPGGIPFHGEMSLAGGRLSVRTRLPHGDPHSAIWEVQAQDLRAEQLHPGPLPHWARSSLLSGKISGRAAGPWGFQGTVRGLRSTRSEPLTLHCSGTLDGQNLSLSEARLKGEDGSHILGGGRIDLERRRFELSGVLYELPGTRLQASLGRLPGNLSFQNITGTMSVKGSMKTPSGPPSVDAGVLRLTVQGLRAGDLQAAKAHVRARIEDGELVLESLDAQGRDGTFEAIHLEGRILPAGPLRLEGEMRGIDLAALTASEGGPGPVRGRAVARFSVQEGRQRIRIEADDVQLTSTGARLGAVTADLLPRPGKDPDLLRIQAEDGSHLTASLGKGVLGKTPGRVARGSFQIGNIAYLTGSLGFLRSGVARGSFVVSRNSAGEHHLGFGLEELSLDTLRGPMSLSRPASGTWSAGGIGLDDVSLSFDGGLLELSGRIGQNGHPWDLKLRTENLPVNFPGLTDGSGGALRGRLLAFAHLQGSPDDPELEAEFSLENPSWGPKALIRGLDRIRGKFSHKQDRLRLDSLSIQQGHEECLIKGDIPLHLSLQPFSVQRGRGQVQIQIDIPPTDLQLARILFPGTLRTAEGQFGVNIRIFGNTAEPEVLGKVFLSADRLALAIVPVELTHLQTELVFNDEGGTLTHFVADALGGRLYGEGRFWLKKDLRLAYETHFRLSELSGADDDLSMQEMAFEANLRGDGKNHDLQGEVTLQKGHVDLEFLLKDRPGLLARLPRSLTYRVRASTDGQFWLKGPQVNAEVQGEVEIRGRGEEHQIRGDLTAVRGAFYFQNQKFDIERGSITWRTPPSSPASPLPWSEGAERPQPPRRSVPYVNAQGRKLIGQTEIYLELQGPAHDLKLTTRSLPPHTQQEILAMLASGSDVGVTASTEAYQSEILAAPLNTAFVDRFLNKPVGSFVRKATGLDEFRIDTRLIQTSSNPNADPRISAGKYLSPNVFLSLDGQVGRDTPFFQHFGLEFKLEKNLALTVEKNMENSNRGLNSPFDTAFQEEELKVGMSYRWKW